MAEYNHPKDAGLIVQLGYNYGNGKGGLGSTIEGTKENSFPSSPIFKGTVPGWTEYRNKVLRGSGDIVPGGQDFQFTTVNGETPSMTYAQNNPPNFGNVVIGSRGKPGSPWTPNTSSPRRESTNPRDLPPPPWSPHADAAVANYGSGVGGTRDPEEASAVQERVNQYDIGKWG